MQATASPHIYYVRKSSGIAGQIAYTARVGYPDESPREVTFIGSTYGGPVVMRTDAGEVFVTEPGRFGTFGPEWVRAFFGVETDDERDHRETLPGSDALEDISHKTDA